MEKNENSGWILIIIELLDKIIKLSFDYLTKFQLLKVKQTGERFIFLGIWFFLIWLFATCMWVSLNCLIFVWIKSFGISLTLMFLVLGLINFLSLLLVVVSFIQTKNKLFALDK